jgi:hypothetical protein
MSLIELRPVDGEIHRLLLLYFNLLQYNKTFRRVICHNKLERFNVKLFTEPIRYS